MSTETTTIQRHQTAENTRAERVYTPRADLLVGEEELRLLVDLPGVPLEGLTVEVNRGQLHLEGRRSESLRYRRVFKLPDGLATDKIVADLANGVLTVTLPKAETHKPRRIQVRSSD